MRRYIVLLLITGIVWAQTDFDKLVLKDGKEYHGEYLRTHWGMLYFKIQNEVSPLGIGITEVQTLQLVNIEKQAVYDAKIKALKWGFYPPLVGTTFLGLMLGLDAPTGEIWDSPLAFPICLGAPYLLLKLNKNNIKSVTSEEIKLYEEIYYKELSRRLFINTIVLSAFTVAAAGIYFLTTFNLNMGPQPPGNY